MKRLSILLGLLLLCFYCFSATYYFSFSSGDDTRTAAQAQSSTTAWKTLDKLLANLNNGTIAAGSTIMLKRGDAWILPKNFIITKALNIDAYGPGNIKPYVTGLQSIPGNGWTLKDATSGVYETTNAITAPNSNTLNMVTINGKPYAMGRTPNANATNAGWLNYEAHTSNSITDNQSPFDVSYVGAQAVVRANNTNIERGNITAISGTTITINTATFTNSINSSNGYGYFVQNSLKCLDQFGEWFYNTSTKKLSVCVGPLNNPANFAIQYPYLDTAIQIQASNVNINHIQLSGTNRYMVYNDWAGLRNIWFRGVDFSYSGGDFVCLLGKIYSGIDSCTATYANSNAFSFPYHNNSVYITNSKLQHIGTFNGMLWPNQASRYGFGVFYGNQQNTTDTGLLCKNVAINDVGYIGVYFDGNNNTIDGVVIDTAVYLQQDGAGIYTDNFTAAGATPKVTHNNTVKNCIVQHALGAAEGTPGNNVKQAHGMYTDDNSNFITIVNNVFANNATAGIFLHNTNRSRVENNLCFNNGEEQLYMQDESLGDSIYNDTIRYNTFMPVANAQQVYYFALGTTTTKDARSFLTFGLIDNNIVATPFGNVVAHLNQFGVAENTYDINNWRTLWHYDLASTGMPFNITSANQILFASNTSNTVTSTVSFPCSTYISASNITYFNQVMLKPLTATVLLLTNQ